MIGKKLVTFENSTDPYVYEKLNCLAAVWDGDASADVRHSSVELHHHPCPQQTKVPSSL